MREQLRSSLTVFVAAMGAATACAPSSPVVVRPADAADAARLAAHAPPGPHPESVTSTSPSMVDLADSPRASPRRGGATGGGDASATPRVELTVVLRSPCVELGATQEVHVRSEANLVVVFDNQYADGRDGAAYGGRETNGRTDAAGGYRSAWVVAPQTPTGRARLDIAVAGPPGNAVRQLEWTVATRCTAKARARVGAGVSS